MTQDTVYLETFKDWLRRTKLPGDKDKLAKAVAWLNRLQLDIKEAERGDIRALLQEAFEATAEDVDALMPEPELPDLEPPSRGPLPQFNGYLGRYADVMVGQQSPDVFHIFSLITAIGAALGRKVWLDMVWFKVWPNISVVLTGPAGGPRKTTACDLAVSAVRGGYKGWVQKPIMDATPQAIVQDLGAGKGDAVGFLYAPEFRHFFPSQQYMEGAVPLITRLLDNPDFYPVSRITRRGDTLQNVTLSMLGGSTLDWLAKLPQDAQGGGFLTRVLIIHEDKAKGRDRARPARGKTKAAADLMAALRAIQRYGHGKMTLTVEAKKWFDRFYARLQEQTVGHPRLLLYFNRKQMHLLRVAMLMALPKKVIHPEDLEAANELLHWIEMPLPDIYRIIGMSRSGELTRAVLDTLKSFGGRMSWADLSREMKGLLNARDFKMSIETLKQAGQIKELQTPGVHMVIVRELNLVE